MLLAGRPTAMEATHDPPPMSRTAKIAYAILMPAGLLALIFIPAGSWTWGPGWLFVAVLGLSMTLSTVAMAKVNPVIFRARSRFQPGTKSWDKALVGTMLPVIAAILPVGAYDAGRLHAGAMPGWLVTLGYLALLASVAGTGWAQAVNPFFEPGVRIQSERGQHVIDKGPYRYVRHPGYAFALIMMAGMAFSLGSYWALVPAAAAGALLVVRTGFEDRLLRRELPGYAAFAGRVRYRLMPGVW
jgi:protein-S-isoprenylcysteine O-methyltransferase Ste14